MPRKKLHYKEGVWFAVPLRSGGFAIGLVARMDGKGSVIGYFFGPSHKEIPSSLDFTKGLTPDDAIFIAHFGDLGLLKGTWKVLGEREPWIREKWPLPAFVRTDVISGKHRKVLYFEDNLLKEVQLVPIVAETAKRLPEDGIFGAGAVEIRLTKLLSMEKPLNPP